MDGKTDARPRWPKARLGALVVSLLLLPLILGAWRDISGNTINPRYVEKIKDGVTTKQEIMILFGEPKEVERSPDGAVFKYYSYKDGPPLGMKPMDDREINPQSTQPYVLDDDKKVKKAKIKTQGTVLRSTLTIYFKGDDKVLSHEYKEY